MHLPNDDVPEATTTAVLSAFVPNVPRDEQRQAFVELNSLWTEIAGGGEKLAGRVAISDKLAKLMGSVSLRSGPPQRNQMDFWKRATTDSGYESWARASRICRLISLELFVGTRLTEVAGRQGFEPRAPSGSEPVEA